mgnify:CR=1 FL=1
MKRSKHHNLKFIKLYFKYFVNVGVSGILFKTLRESGIDLDGDTLLGVSRFGFGKNRIKNLYVNVKQNVFVILKDRPADGPDVPSMYPKIIPIKDPKTVKDLEYNATVKLHNETVDNEEKSDDKQ